MKMSREIRYAKPNIGALHGKIGLSIVETIMNAQRPDRSKLKAESQKYEERILAIREKLPQ